ncbi:MAG: hypothetical protein ACYC2P_12185 [Paludibacteraceae bacterium]
MKKSIYFIFTFILTTIFMACEPIVLRDSIGDIITSADQLQATVTPIMDGTKVTNKVKVSCTSPVVCQWTDGVKTYISNDTALTLFVTGNQTITLNAMTNDGKIYTKDYPVKVDEMKFPVAPQYGYFCGTGVKSWTWAATKCFGNGHAYDWDPVNKVPEWWVLSPSDVTDQCSGKGLPKEGAGASVKLTLKGLKMELIDADGKVISTGKFSFDMTADSHNWSSGKFNVVNTNILFGYDLNGGLVPWAVYDIMVLNENEFSLGAKGADGTYWYWVFVPKP